MKSLLLQNILLGISLAAPIGPVAVEMIRRGLRFGFSSAFAVALGAIIGDAIYLFLSYFGLYHFLTNTLIKSSVLFFGSLVLVYLGMQCFKEISDSFDTEQMTYKKKRKLVLLGCFLAVANPMSIVWWLGIFGASMASQETVPHVLEYTPILLGVLIWDLAVSLVLELGSRFINKKVLRIASGLAGLSLAGFGLYFGYQSIVSLFF